MTIFLLCLVLSSLALALLPAVWFQCNLRAYAPPGPLRPQLDVPAVSVLIPARNEEHGIGPAVAAALQSRGVAFEVVVLDDHSEDATAEVVNRLADTDRRVRLVHAPDLPEGWCGKQHACWVLAHEARNPVMVFLDADVRLAPTRWDGWRHSCMRRRFTWPAAFRIRRRLGWLEKLVIPLIHFILLGFLPLKVMRRTTKPHFAAGCGQLFITTRDAYDQAGGHAAIRTTLHDGIKLPRAYRTAGLRTDLFDATELAECRMYRSAGAMERSGQKCRRGARLARANRADDAAPIGGPGTSPGPPELGDGLCARSLAGVGPCTGCSRGGCGILSAAGCSAPVSPIVGGRTAASSGRAGLGIDSMVRISPNPAWSARHLERAGLSGPSATGNGTSRATNPMKQSPTRTITLDDRPINLTQVLKLGGCVQSGGEAKILIAEGQVRVNGQVELRKRCQMKAGDRVTLEGGPTIVLLAGLPTGSAPPEEDPAGATE